MRSEFEGLGERSVFCVLCSVLCNKRLLQVVDFSDGFVIGKNRIVNEAVTW